MNSIGKPVFSLHQMMPCEHVCLLFEAFVSIVILVERRVLNYGQQWVLNFIENKEEWKIRKIIRAHWITGCNKSMFSLTSQQRILFIHLKNGAYFPIYPFNTNIKYGSYVFCNIEIGCVSVNIDNVWIKYCQ